MIHFRKLEILGTVFLCLFMLGVAGGYKLVVGASLSTSPTIHFMMYFVVLSTALFACINFFHAFILLFQRNYRQFALLLSACVLCLLSIAVFMMVDIEAFGAWSA